MDLRPNPCQTKCFTDGSLAGWEEEGLPWLTPAGRGRWWSFWCAQGRRWAGWGGPLCPPGHGPPPTAAAGRLVGPLPRRWHPAAQTAWWKKQQPDSSYTDEKTTTTKTQLHWRKKRRKKREKKPRKIPVTLQKNKNLQTPVTLLPEVSSKMKSGQVCPLLCVFWFWGTFFSITGLLKSVRS